MKQETQVERQLRPATLGNSAGVGLITVMRDAEGTLVEANGSWRPEEGTLERNELGEVFKIGATTTYEGAIVDRDARQPDIEEASVTVVISSVEDYTYLDGTVHTVVNFVSKDLV